MLICMHIFIMSLDITPTTLQVLFRSLIIPPYQANLCMKPKAKPKFHRPRPVPYAIKEAIGEELDRMEADGIIEKITHSDWAAPIVAVPKRDGKFRICGDYKVTINSELGVDQYPLPKPEDLFATLAGGQKFTTLDLSQAYLQLSLDEEFSQYTINSRDFTLELCQRHRFSRRPWIRYLREFPKPCVILMTYSLLEIMTLSIWIS